MGKLKEAYGINEQQAKKEWVYSGSTVGLQWFKNAWWMNKRQIQNKEIMEVRKRLLGAFNFAKVWNFGKVHTTKGSVVT